MQTLYNALFGARERNPEQKPKFWAVTQSSVRRPNRAFYTLRASRLCSALFGSERKRNCAGAAANYFSSAAAAPTGGAEEMCYLVKRGVTGVMVSNHMVME
jgi:hypothetical protein